MVWQYDMLHKQRKGKTCYINGDFAYTKSVLMPVTCHTVNICWYLLPVRTYGPKFRSRLFSEATHIYFHITPLVVVWWLQFWTLNHSHSPQLLTRSTFCKMKQIFKTGIRTSTSWKRQRIFGITCKTTPKVSLTRKSCKWEIQKQLYRIIFQKSLQFFNRGALWEACKKKKILGE